MNSLLRSIPLIINLPVDDEASQEYFEQHLIDNETAFLEAIIIAERLANVPAIMASSRPISVAVSSSSVIIGIKLAQIEQWADGISECEPFWFFSLREGHAVPCFPSSYSDPKKVATAHNSRETAKKLNSLEEKQKDVAELQGKPTAKAYYLTSLRKLFHRVNVESIKEVLNDFMAELDDDAFCLDPEQKEILDSRLRGNDIGEGLDSRLRGNDSKEEGVARTGYDTGEGGSATANTEIKPGVNYDRMDGAATEPVGMLNENGVECGFEG